MHPPPPTSTLFPYTTLFRSIWNYARSAQQIADNKNLEIPTAPGLIGRWGLRSEERRVGKECRCRGMQDSQNKNPHRADGCQPRVGALGMSCDGDDAYVSLVH